jgi:lipopolysaccharide exporter
MPGRIQVATAKCSGMRHSSDLSINVYSRALATQGPTVQMKSLRLSMAQGAVWMVLFKTLERSLGLISMLILARLLVPADFGLLAMATSLIALLEMFSAFGLDTALIQRNDAVSSHYNTAWTLNVLAGCTIALLMLVLALPASHFYKDPRLAPVIAVLAIGAAIQGCENVGVVAFRKEMRFDREFRFLLAKKILQFATTVPLAFLLHNYWALVAGTIMGRAGGVSLSYMLHPFRPRLSLAAVADLMHFSKWLVAQNFLSFLKERSADIVIGRFAGPHSLGVFSASAEISNMPGTELVAPINRAILPAYVKLAQDKPALRREYLSVMSMVALIAVPAVAGFAVTAPFLVLLVLGPKWLEASTLIQILAFYGITQVLQSNAYSAFIALGKPQVFVKINAIHVAILLTTLPVLTWMFGVHGAAWAYVFTAVVMLPLNFMFITRAIEVRAADFFSCLWRPIVAAILMYFGVRALGPAFPATVIPSSQAAGSLIVSVLLGVPMYIAAVTILWLISGRPPGAESAVLKQARLAWSRARTWLAPSASTSDRRP